MIRNRIVSSRTRVRNRACEGMHVQDRGLVVRDFQTIRSASRINAEAAWTPQRHGNIQITTEAAGVPK
jgi:hypothetical protein